MPDIDFPVRLEKWRLFHGLIQKEAAVVFDVPTGTYRTWEKGSRTPCKLSLIEIERRMLQYTEESERLHKESYMTKRNEQVLLSAAFHQKKK